MTEEMQLIVYAAAYDTRWAALADFDALDQREVADVIGHYDAAMIELKDGKPHIVKRMDRPWIRVIPEAFGRGTLPRKELHDAAETLMRSDAGLVVVAEQGTERAFDVAFPRASAFVKRSVQAPTVAQISRQLEEALGGSG